MPVNAAHTANYVQFKDNLFDSINGQILTPDKPLQGVLSDDSPHIEF